MGDIDGGVSLIEVEATEEGEYPHLTDLKRPDLRPLMETSDGGKPGSPPRACFVEIGPMLAAAPASPVPRTTATS